MSIEERFNAAVNVIRGLPKNGPYQPSNDMLLRFYSYFKQAKQGKCCERKPAFWDVVNRAKWEAWNRLGEMPKEVAMQKYVDELKKIVETMSYTDNVANFMEYNMSDLDNVNINDLEMVAPEAIKKARSRPNSPLASREASPVGRLSPATPSPPPMPVSSQPPTATLVNGHVHKPTAINGYAPQHNQQQHHNHQDHNHHHQWNGDGVNSSLSVTNGTSSSGPSELSDDEYIDTLDDEFESATVSAVFRPIEAVNHGHSYHSRTPHDHSFRASENSLHFPANGGLQNGDVSLQIARTVEQLNVNLQRVMGRVSTIEQSLDALREQQQQQLVKLSASTATAVSLRSRQVGPTWWPFTDVSPATLAFIILWPLVVHRVARWAQRKKL
ncbi:acyl-CoA-binding domain-containing protein 5A [Anopheles bellator]|uniref:acyl-CoA-binding domain-containing protein 5A n=1 Tax=Anopheles bellator TaxID=139047 RepID=UPI00264A1024|nr:acyl-CoA-binding domain-containing protein 5A [Anopheles bellator]